MGRDSTRDANSVWGSVKCLGIHYDLDLIGATQYDMFMAELQHVVAIARTRRASPDMLRAVS